MRFLVALFFSKIRTYYFWRVTLILFHIEWWEGLMYAKSIATMLVQKNMSTCSLTFFSPTRKIDAACNNCDKKKKKKNSIKNDRKINLMLLVNRRHRCTHHDTITRFNYVSIRRKIQNQREPLAERFDSRTKISEYRVSFSFWKLFFLFILASTLPLNGDKYGWNSVITQFVSVIIQIQLLKQRLFCILNSFVRNIELCLQLIVESLMTVWQARCIGV